MYVIPTRNGRAIHRSIHRAIGEIQSLKKRVVSLRCEPKYWDRFRLHAKNQWPDAVISYNARLHIGTIDFLPEDGNHDLDLTIRDIDTNNFSEGHILRTEGVYYIWVKKTTIVNQYNTGYLTAQQIKAVVKDMKAGKLPTRNLSKLELLLAKLKLAMR